MLGYREQSANGLQANDFDMDVENEDYVKQQPHIWGNEEDE
jgi:hypothetical protein